MLFETVQWWYNGVSVHPWLPASFQVFLRVYFGIYFVILFYLISDSYYPLVENIQVNTQVINNI